GGTRERVARRFVEVAEESDAAVFQGGGAVFVLPVEAGNEVIDQRRDGGVLANNDETGRHTNALLLPQLEGFLVVAVESLERGLQAGGKFEGIEFLTLAAPFLRHVLADVFPKVAVNR